MAFVMAAVGDIVVTRPLEAALSKPGVRAVLSHLRDADFVVGNLEIPLCEGGRAQEKMVAHRASPAVIPALSGMGFRSLVLANNHAMDFGSEGLLETVSRLASAGISALGAGADLSEALRVQEIGNGDASVALLAVSALLPLGAAAGSTRPGIAPVRVHTSYDVDPNLLLEQPGTPPRVRTELHEGDVGTITRLIEDARARADAVVIFVHWGIGAQQERAEYQQVLGRRLVDAGADVVIGCHPHTIQEIAPYGRGVIFYNLGEFFSQYPKEGLPPDVAALLSRLQPEGYILKLTFTRGKRTGIEIVPLAIDAEGDPTPENSDRVAAKIARLCEGGACLIDGTLMLTADEMGGAK